MAYVTESQYAKDMEELKETITKLQDELGKSTNKIFQIEMLNQQHTTALAEQTAEVGSTAENIRISNVEAQLLRDRIENKMTETDRVIAFLETNIGEHAAKFNEIERGNGEHVATMLTQIAHETQAEQKRQAGELGDKVMSTVQGKIDKIEERISQAKQSVEDRFYILEENVSEIKRFESEVRQPRSKEDKRRVRLPKPTELSLKTLGEDRVAYRDFVEDLDNQLGNVWTGLDRALEKIRKEKDPITEEKYLSILSSVSLPPAESYESDWSKEYIGRYLYTVLFQSTKTGSDSRKTIKRVKDKDGFEALRQLHEIHDPLELNTTSIKFEDITMAAKVSFKTPEQMVTVIKDLRKKIEEYEESFGDLGNGVAMSQASTILSNADYEIRKHLITQNATQDLRKMQQAAEELKKVNMIARPNRKMDIQLLAPLYDKEEWDDKDFSTWAEHGGEAFEEAWSAQDPEVLYALGKGGWQSKGGNRWRQGVGKGGKGGKGKGKDGKGGKGDGKGSKGPTGGPGGTQGKGGYVETRDCLICWVKGHIARNCPDNPRASGQSPGQQKGAIRQAAEGPTADPGTSNPTPANQAPNSGWLTQMSRTNGPSATSRPRGRLCQLTTAENKVEEPKGIDVDECEWPTLSEPSREETRESESEDSTCECALLAAKTIIAGRTAAEQDEEAVVQMSEDKTSRKRAKVMRMPRRKPQKLRRKRACRSTAQGQEASEEPKEILPDETETGSQGSIGVDIPTPGEGWKRPPRARRVKSKSTKLCEHAMACALNCCAQDDGIAKETMHPPQGSQSDGADGTVGERQVRRVSFDKNVKTDCVHAEGGSLACNDGQDCPRQEDRYSALRGLFTTAEVADIKSCTAKMTTSMAMIWVKGKVNSRIHEREQAEREMMLKDIESSRLASLESPGRPSPIPGCLHECGFVSQGCLQHRIGCTSWRSTEYDIRTGRKVGGSNSGNQETRKCHPESTDHWHGSADDGSPGGEVKKQHSKAALHKPKLCGSGSQQNGGLEFSVDELFGNALIVPKYDSSSLPLESRLCYFKEREGMLMAAMEGWEKVTLMVDSGASDTVVPPSVCKSAEMHTTPKVGIEYECANGKPLYNLGERRCEAMLTKGGEVIGMAFQVVDVGRSLLSVSRVCAQGHDVVFSEKKGSFIHLDGDPRKAIPLRNSGGVFELDVWVRPSGFARQGGIP